MTKRIGVLGCGWLGLPLAKRFISQDFKVYGTSTSLEKLQQLQKSGIHPYQIRLTENGINGDIQAFLSNVDILIINVPPKLRGEHKESFIEKMKFLHAEIKKSDVSKVIFVSSTSVYGDTEGEIIEETPAGPATESGKQLLASEQLFIQNANLSTTIIRFGGLIGPHRHPVTMLTKRKGLSNGNHPVNLIHLEDCIHMISTIIEENYWNEIFNGVYPLHPTKKEYYTSEAEKRKIPAPNYDDQFANKLGKTVLSKNFFDKGHAFTHNINS
ncbi:MULTISPECIES: SDR family oxidoreductase [Flavobacteriaceae]|uniref:SDR family oxidoreductase n=1 Tax=Flavobacteriaceae TaxID=49546 RepID=UPI001491562B|nr:MULTISPECIES: SDR family oxidoreductase [Allomuricauda]MDC6366182.1 SDR family oxidoreductase [Muricauda sp. AC10]